MNLPYAIENSDGLQHLAIVYGEGAVEAWMAFESFCVMSLPWSDASEPLLFTDSHLKIFLTLSEIFLADVGMSASMRVMLSGLRGERLTVSDLPLFMAFHESLTQKIDKDCAALLQEQELAAHIAFRIESNVEGQVRALPRAREVLYRVLMSVGCRSQKSASRLAFPREPMKAMLTEIALDNGVPVHLVQALHMHMDAAVSGSPWTRPVDERACPEA